MPTASSARLRGVTVAGFLARAAARAGATAGDSVSPTALRAFLASRATVGAAGIFGVLAIGAAPWARAFDPAGLTRPYRYFGNLLAAPFARWDSVWYLAIAHGGYGHQPARTAFFPLYPLLVRGVEFVLGDYLVAGVLISLVSFLVALVVLERLVRLECGEETARLTVLLVAFCPMAYFFSAIYSESLYLALSVACLLCARQDRWFAAGVLGALAAASRSSGILLLVPLLLMFAQARARQRWWRDPALGWVLLVPAGLGAYMLYLSATGMDPLAPFHAQQVWFRHFAGPLGGVWDGAVAAWEGMRQLIHGPAPPVYFRAAGGDPLTVAGQNLMLFAFLIVGLTCCVRALRRLPLAYGAYALAGLAVPLSYPVTPQPLASLPRYEVVLFPLFMAAAGWVRERAWEREAVAASAVLLGLFTVQFATWHFVA